MLPHLVFKKGFLTGVLVLALILILVPNGFTLKNRIVVGGAAGTLLIIMGSYYLFEKHMEKKLSESSNSIFRKS